MHCANWDAGTCLGCDIRTQDGKLILNIDSKKENKECTLDEGCAYFDRVVVPSIL